MPSIAPAAGPVETSDAAGRNALVQLQRSAVFRDYQQAFETTTGLPLALRATGSFQFPLHGSKHANAFCTLLSGNSKTCGACLNFQQRVEQGAVFGSRTMQCFAGLTESAVPLRVGDRVIGYLQTGQVLLRPPTAARFRLLARQLAGLSPQLNPPRLKEAYFKTRVMTRRQYDAVVKLLEFFAQHLASLSNQILMQGTLGENPAIERAKTYMAAHQNEALSLRRVAEEAHRSPFYFCKIFKQDTGLTFTDYLARLRIRSSKQMLQNPRMRISEAAFATGFQSLSQFNRAYRRIEGESPTIYRGRLHQEPAQVFRGIARSA